MKILNYFKKKTKPQGKHIFTFPDGRKLMQINDEDLERLPSEKLRTIQENANYIAYLGISKHTLIEAHKMVKNTAYEARVLAGGRDKAATQNKIDDIIKVIEQMDITRTTFDGINETILVSTFDLFFFFEDENPFTWSTESLERKRKYLNDYPFFRSFFFQKASEYMGDYSSILSNATRYALAQTQAQEIVRRLEFTNISSNKTD